MSRRQLLRQLYSREPILKFQGLSEHRVVIFRVSIENFDSLWTRRHDSINAQTSSLTVFNDDAIAGIVAVNKTLESRIVYPNRFRLKPLLQRLRITK